MPHPACLRRFLGRSRLLADESTPEAAACTWDRLREVYEEQAARGIPGAARGPELIDQGRWPSSGRPRGRQALLAPGKDRQGPR